MRPYTVILALAFASVLVAPSSQGGAKTPLETHCLLQTEVATPIEQGAAIINRCNQDIRIQHIVGRDAQVAVNTTVPAWDGERSFTPTNALLWSDTPPLAVLLANDDLNGGAYHPTLQPWTDCLSIVEGVVDGQLLSNSCPEALQVQILCTASGSFLYPVVQAYPGQPSQNPDFPFLPSNAVYLPHDACGHDGTVIICNAQVWTGA